MKSSQGLAKLIWVYLITMGIVLVSFFFLRYELNLAGRPELFFWIVLTISSVVASITGVLWSYILKIDNIKLREIVDQTDRDRLLQKMTLTEGLFASIWGLIFSLLITDFMNLWSIKQQSIFWGAIAVLLGVILISRFTYAGYLREFSEERRKEWTRDWFVFGLFVVSTGNIAISYMYKLLFIVLIPLLLMLFYKLFGWNSRFQSQVIYPVSIAILIVTAGIVVVSLPTILRYFSDIGQIVRFVALFIVPFGILYIVFTCSFKENKELSLSEN